MNAEIYPFLPYTILLKLAHNHCKCALFQRTCTCQCVFLSVCVTVCVCVDAALTLIWFSAWGPRQAVVTFLTVHCWISPLRQLCACICVTECVCVCVYVFRCIACRLCVNHLIFTHPSRHVPNGHHLLLKFIDPLLIFGSALEIIMDLRCCCRSARVN